MIGTARTRYLRKLRTPPDNNLVELLGASSHATRYVKNLRSHTLQKYDRHRMRWRNPSVSFQLF